MKYQLLRKIVELTFADKPLGRLFVFELTTCKSAADMRASIESSCANVSQSLSATGPRRWPTIDLTALICVNNTVMLGSRTFSPRCCYDPNHVEFFAEHHVALECPLSLAGA